MNHTRDNNSVVDFLCDHCAIIPKKSPAHIKHNKIRRFPYQHSSSKWLYTLENFWICIILKTQMNISRIPQIMSIKIAEVSIKMLFKLSVDWYHKQCLTENIQGIHQWQMNKFIKIKLWIETPLLKSCTNHRVKKTRK